MSGAADWRDLIEEAVGATWPELKDGPKWIEAQVGAESNGDPRAVSSCGAQGLLQLMPATAADVGVANPFDPSQNLLGGITYLRRQYERLDADLKGLDRLFWSFAAYNAGFGYVKLALVAAKADGDLPRSSGQWYSWPRSWPYLFHRSAAHRGRWADYRQVVGYVASIRRRYLGIR